MTVYHSDIGYLFSIGVKFAKLMLMKVCNIQSVSVHFWNRIPGFSGFIDVGRGNIACNHSC